MFSIDADQSIVQDVGMDMNKTTPKTLTLSIPPALYAELRRSKLRRRSTTDNMAILNAIDQAIRSEKRVTAPQEAART